jgi:dihydroorotase-like cyclic amidohydrolase
MTTTIIKNGTVITADLTTKADVRVEGGTIIEMRQVLPLTAARLSGLRDSNEPL